MLVDFESYDFNHCVGINNAVEMDMKDMSSNIKIAWSGRAALGESGMWHPIEKKLYWIDITKGHINRLDVETGENQYVKVSGILGTVVGSSRGGVLATLSNNIISFDFANQEFATIATVFPADRKDLRMNDGKCDRRGRFWIGVASQEKTGHGGLYRYDIDGTLTLMEKDVIFSNGLTWSPDNKYFYYVDTAKYCVYKYDFDLDKGTINNLSILLKLDNPSDKPDGLTIDREGFLWLALYNGGKIIRIRPNGEIDNTIVLPVERPTSCVFGGHDEATLFVTSCSRDLHEVETLKSPAGDIFALQVKIGGLPEPLFNG
jgi:sugar lactone lactonase YvrE